LFYQESVRVTEAGTRLSQIYGPKRCAGYTTHKSSETKNEKFVKVCYLAWKLWASQAWVVCGR